MKICIPSLYAEYGRYIDRFRAIPYYLDVLKPIERRLLLMLFKYAKNKLVKSAKIIGNLIAEVHPHGDQAAYGSLVYLVHRNMATGQGNWGSIAYEETDAAAMRYTEIQSSNLVNTLGFELVNYTIPWTDPENLNEKQPVFLPSPIPIGLIGSGISQGISFNTTKIPRYTFEDLTTRLVDIINKKTNPAVIPKTIIPNMPGCNVYEGQPGEFERLLTTGEGIIKIVPNIQIKKDGIYVYGRPPAGFTNLKNEEKKLEDKGEKCPFKIIDLSAKKMIEIFIQPSDMKIFNQKFIDYIYQLLMTSINFTCKVVDETDNVNLKSIDWLLETGYNVWIGAYYNKLCSDKIKLEEKQYELQVIAVIKEIISDNKLQTMTDLINIYKSNYSKIYINITEDTIKQVCSKHRIQKLLDYNTDLTSVQYEINNIISLLSNIQVSAYNKFLEIYKQVII